MQHPIECQCCRQPLRSGLADWHFYCPACSYEAASLTPSINDESNPVKPDEVERETGLRVVRQRNFVKIIERVRQLCDAASPRLLEVGCAHGLFLEMVARDFDAVGIEPHREVARETAARGFAVREGYFPSALQADDRFDVIVFNDVLEHIPDLPDVLRACRDCLNDNGILVINLPDSSGIFYRLSRLLARIGIRGMFERMWQLNYPSPHLHYFNGRNLQQLISAHSFDQLYCARLDSLVADGLFDRIAHTKEYSLPVAYLMYAAARLSIPLLGMLPADIQLQIFRKRGQAHTPGGVHDRSSGRAGDQTGITPGPT